MEPSLSCICLVQDFVQTVKLLLAPHGLLVLAHQIRRSVSHSCTPQAQGA